MKDSGIEWIGEIPETWNICRTKDVCYLYTGNSIKDEEKEFYEDNENARPYIATKHIDSVLCSVEYDNGMYVKLNDYNFKVAPKGSTLMCIEGGSAGRKKAIIDREVSFVNKLCCFEPKATFNERFLYYYLSFPGYEEEFRRNISGLIGGVSVSQLKTIPIIMPRLKEQERIADYLDQQCAHIDAVIEKTKASFEEYKKLKQAVITQAVTKGIRGNRPMKDSGIEFVGIIPEVWETNKFGRCVSVSSNLVNPDLYLDYPQIAPDNIEKGSARLLDNVRSVREVGVISWNHLFYEGQILYSKIRPMLNKLVIAPFDGLCSADMYPIETDNEKRFIVYLMLSDLFLAQVGLVTMNRVKMPKINQNELANIRIPVPPLNEQIEIADYLDKYCQEIDLLIDKKEEMVVELENYKKSLIYEYVTGKKEVPQSCQ